MRSRLPLSPNEERFVLAGAMSSETFDAVWTVRLKGRLDERRFREAIQQMCQRHEARRTGYEAAENGRFTRYVEAHARPTVTWFDMRGGGPEAVRARIRKWFARDAEMTPPNMNRFVIIRVAEDEHVFGSVFHHATNDGETQRGALQEIFQRYDGELPVDEPVQYGDLWDWDWENSPAYRSAEAFWRARLANVSEVGGLPEDGGDPPHVERSGPLRLPLTPALVAEAKRAAVGVGVSEFNFYYAVAVILLSRLTGQAQVCTAFQSSGRRVVSPSEGVHGVFSNAVLLASKVDPGASIGQLARDLRADVRAALENELYPYHHVMRATGLHAQFGINWFPEIPSFSSRELTISDFDMSYGTFDYDLNLRFVRDLGSGGLDLVIFFREDAFSRTRVQAIAEWFAAALATFAPAPDAPIGEVIATVPPGAARVPDDSASLPEGGGQLIHQRFLEQVRLRPAAVAIEHDGVEWTYEEVAQRSADVAGSLRDVGVGPGDRVAILAERRSELVWSILGAARLGAAFVLVDAAYPEARLEILLDIARPRAMLAGGPVAELAGRLAARRKIPLVEPQGRHLDAAPETWDQASLDDPAYVLFTSGSTGLPKGVAVSHRPLSNFIDWHEAQGGLTADDRFSMLSGLAHDPVLRDIFTPLSIGATLSIPAASVVGAPEALAGWFRERGITVVHMTPAHGQVLAAGARNGLPALRRVFWGGDQLPPDLVRRIAEIAPKVRQCNFYGSTETPQAVGAFVCEGDYSQRSVPVGQGANGAELLIVDNERQPVGPLECGEIAVRSNYLSLGYLRDGEIAAPEDRGIDAEGRANIYYTGDRGLYLPNGDVLMLGRADDQVKVRGYRVDLFEVAAALKAHPQVGKAVVLPVGEGADLRIYAFVTGRRRMTAPSEDALRIFLAGRLADYMQPRGLRVLETLPLLPNGKVDRKTLQDLASEPAEIRGPDLSHANATERALMEKWSALLGQTAIWRESSFASLGGDSLSYVQAYMATEEIIGVVPKRWQFLTIAELAASKRERAGSWTTIDSPMLVRAASISLVVMGHLGLVAYGGGATTALFMVSGFLFGGLQLREAFNRASAGPILRALVGITIPTFIYAVFAFSHRSIRGRQTTIDIPMLNNDLIDYSKLPPGATMQDYQVHLWYVDALIKMLAFILIIFVAYSFLDRRMKKSGRDLPLLTSLQFAVVLFVFGCATRFLLPGAFVPDFFAKGVEELTVFAQSSTTHLATFMLGVLLAHVSSRRSQWALAALCTVYALVTWRFFHTPAMVSVLASGVILLAFDRVALPRPVATVVLTLSGASLFIYLTHYMFGNAFGRIIGVRHPAVETAAALLGGAGLWLGWNWLTKQFNVRRQRRAALLALP